MSTFVPPRSARRWQEFRRWVGRIPLRIKLITAVLALVAIALAVISIVSIALFRDYQIRRASEQVTAVFYEIVNELNGPHGLQPGDVQGIGSYLVAMRPVGSQLSTPGNLTSVPDVPSSPAWLAANRDKLVDVPAVSGTDNWRVITAQVTYRGIDPSTGEFTTQRDTLIV